MCSRYTFGGKAAEINKRLGLKMVELTPRYNIAPTQAAVVIAEHLGGREMRSMRWGLVPAWAKDPVIGSRMINARAESLADKPSFREAFKRRRCLIPADGFFEWKSVPGTSRKQPYRILMKNEEPFVFAGLWESWLPGADGDPMETFTIITTTPNAVASRIHDRMPVILKAGDQEQWLNPRMTDSRVMTSLLAPYPAEAMKSYPVNPLVGNSKHDGPECIEPVAEQGDLFG